MLLPGWVGQGLAVILLRSAGAGAARFMLVALASQSASGPCSHGCAHRLKACELVAESISRIHTLHHLSIPALIAPDLARQAQLFYHALNRGAAEAVPFDGIIQK